MAYFDGNYSTIKREFFDHFLIALGNCEKDYFCHCYQSDWKCKMEECEDIECFEPVEPKKYKEYDAEGLKRAFWMSRRKKWP
jgi:hypothetical protein